MMAQCSIIKIACGRIIMKYHFTTVLHKVQKIKNPGINSFLTIPFA